MSNRTKIALRYIASLFLIGAIIFMPAMALASEISDADDPGTNKDGTSENDMDDKQMASSCTEKAENANMFGVFNTENGMVDGRFVAFDYADGALFNYTLKTEEDILIISSLTIENFEPTTEPKTSGAMFMMNGTGSRIMAHNNPTGMIQVTANKDDQSVVIILELANGLALEKRSNGTYEVVGLTDRAYVRVGGAEVVIKGSSIEVEIGSEGHLMFISVPVNGYGGNEYRYKYTESVMNGSIDSELDIVTSNGKYLTQKFNYQGKVQMKLRSMEQNRLKIMVSSEEHKGKVVGIGLDKESIGNAKKNQLQVKLDGELLIEASGAQDVLGAKQGDEGSYYIEEHSGGYHAMVYVPEFSEHELIIEKISSVEEDSSTAFIPDLSIIGVIIAIIVGLMIFTWRKKTCERE